MDESEKFTRLDQPITVLELKKRPLKQICEYFAKESKDITLRELILLSPVILLKTRLIGRKSLDNIEIQLAKQGLTLSTFHGKNNWAIATHSSNPATHPNYCPDRQEIIKPLSEMSDNEACEMLANECGSEY